MAKSSAAGRIIAIPLNKLHVSARNARPNDTSDVTGLAALLRSQGQLQNMVVHPDGDDYGVADGGRRLRAFGLLLSQGHVKPDHAVYCMVTDDARALSASIAANSERESMHPADEFEAFMALTNDGTPIEDIAAQFGVTPLVVRRRLLLAKVSPKLIALYRAGEMTLEQLQAFTLVDDHKLQEKVWNSATHSWLRDAHHLREALMKGAKSTGSDRAAKFVGLDAYEAAGGKVVRDLFGAPDSGYIADDQLMQTLAAGKLEGVAQQLRDEGWSFVKIVPDMSWSVTQAYNRSKPRVRNFTAEEQAEIEQLEAVAAATEQALQEDEDDQLTDGERAELEHKNSKAVALINELKGSLETYSDRQKKGAGAILGVNHQGVLEIHRGMIAPPDPKAQKAKEKETARAAAVERGEPEPSGFSEALMRKLTANRTAALAAHLLDCPRVALDLLCAQLATQLIYRGGWYGAAGVHISPTSQSATLLSAAGEQLETSKAWLAIEARRAELLKRLPENPADLFGWLGLQSELEVIEILCFCTATSLNAIVGSESASRPLAAVEDAIGLDLADWWQPTRESFLNQVPKAVTVAALQEAGAGADVVKAVGAAKKTEAAELAEAELRDSGWLPAPLRGPHYAMNTAARTKRPANEAPAAKKRASTRQPARAKQVPAKKAVKTGTAKSGKRFAVKAVPTKTKAASPKQPVPPGLDPAAAWPFPNTGRP
ncbi:ParB N-terminal domain-containing protein [Paraburkholderia sp. BR14261]